MKNKIYVGFISGPFGIKGEVKIISKLDHLNNIFKVGNNLIIENMAYKIKTYRKHKNYNLVAFEDKNDINLIENFIKKDVYILRESLNLDKDEYLNSDLLGMLVLSDEKEIGYVSEILENKYYTYIKVNGIIVPVIKKYVEKIDVQKKCIYVKNIEELIL